MNGPCDRTRMRIKLRIKGRARLRSPLFPSVLSRDFSPIILRFRFVFQMYRVIDRFRESGSRERERGRGIGRRFLTDYREEFC